MKIEFVKETKWDGTTFFYTNQDGVYISDSIKTSEAGARKIYEKILANNGITPTQIEILETIDTEQQPQNYETNYNPEDLKPLPEGFKDLLP
jgi:hypothetical protein